MADQTGDGRDRGERNSLDLEALAVSDRFWLFNFTRRDDHVAYLWVLRTLDRLRGVHYLAGVRAHEEHVLLSGSPQPAPSSARPWSRPDASYSRKASPTT
jgi:hypothetical protein